MRLKLSLLAAALGLIVPLLLSVPSVRAEEEGEPWTVLEVRDADGEQCLVCKQAIHEGEIVELRYKGRRFHVASKMLERFEGDPELFFASLEAHSALFDEGAGSGPQMTNGWLYFGIYVLIGLVAAAICAYLALARGKPAAPWFFAGLVANVFAIIALLASGKGDLSNLPGGVPPGLAKVPTTRAPVPCSACGMPNHPAAHRCSACGTQLTPSIDAETARV